MKIMINLIQNNSKLVLSVIGFIALVVVAWFYQDQLINNDNFNLAITYKNQYPLIFAGVLFIVYVIFSALALPGCGPLTVFAGVIYGWAIGALFAGLASTLGAVITYWIAHNIKNRNDYASKIQSKYVNHWLVKIENENGLRKDIVLLFLRFFPVIPFPMINALCGATNYHIYRFTVVSFVGLTLGSVPYTLVGRLVVH